MKSMIVLVLAGSVRVHSLRPLAWNVKSKRFSKTKGESASLCAARAAAQIGLSNLFLRLPRVLRQPIHISMFQARSLYSMREHR
jgi:hypothetical protein